MKNKYHSDINKDYWINFYITKNIHPFIYLTRLDRPIGIWLLFIPCCIGLFTANIQHNISISSLTIFIIIFFLCSMMMRSVGCIWNDIIDKDLDQKVERTRHRPLANGDIKIWQAITLMIVLSLLSLSLILFFLPSKAIIIAISSLILVIIYPFMKRITWFPQIWLGLTFNWGIWVGWFSIYDSFSLITPLLFYFASVFWTLAYDTIYAYQDYEDDTLIGIKSTARLFYHHARLFLIISFLCFWILLCLVGYMSQYNMYYFIILIFILSHIVWQCYVFNKDNPEICLMLFKSNRYIGLMLLTALLLANIY